MVRGDQFRGTIYFVTGITWRGGRGRVECRLQDVGRGRKGGRRSRGGGESGRRPRGRKERGVCGDRRLRRIARALATKVNGAMNTQHTSLSHRHGAVTDRTGCSRANSRARTGSSRPRPRSGQRAVMATAKRRLGGARVGFGRPSILPAPWSAGDLVPPQIWYPLKSGTPPYQITSQCPVKWYPQGTVSPG